MDTKLQLKRIDSQQLFFILFFTAVVNTVLFASVTSSNSLLGLFFLDRDDSFMDLFNPIAFTRSVNPYDNADMGAIYPALCYVIYKFLSLFFSPDIADAGAKAMRSSAPGALMTVFFSQLFFIALVLFCLYMFRNKSKLYTIAMIISVLFASPIIYQWERANILGLALILLMFYIVEMDSENKVIREMAYICLALSASLKIYPAVFGILLLLEKRWKDAVKTAIYGVIAFFLPFFFFDGINSIKCFITNLTGGAQTTNYNNTGVGFRIDLATNISLIKWLLGKNGSIPTRWQTLILVLLCAVLAAGIFLLKDKWKKLLCITVIMIIIPAFGFEYSACFYVIPFAYFMQESRKGVMDYFYSFAFFMILAPVTFRNVFFTDVWPIWSFYGLTLTVFLINLGQILMMILVSISLAIEIISRIKMHQPSKKSDASVKVN